MADGMLCPREAGQYIAEHSHDVTINMDGVKKVTELIMDCLKINDPVIHTDRWKTHKLNPKTEDQAAVDWVFLSDVGNFSFWSADPEHRYCVKSYGETWTGYWAWAAAINRAINDGIPFTSAAYLQNLTASQLKNILRSDSDTEMPLFDERLRVLKEAGTVLMEKYGGSFVNVLKTCNKSAKQLMEIVVRDFPSFQDIATYKGKKVALYKRVQILIADIWACCGGKGLGEFHDIDEITMFADYRIPQMLAWFGALNYSESLNNKMKEGRMFQSGEREEVEIRGCTIWAVELIVKEVRQLMKADSSVPADTLVNAVLIDHYLWDYRREHSAETDSVPIHRTRCIYY